VGLEWYREMLNVVFFVVGYTMAFVLVLDVWVA
jgi:uncharacterized membrane protein YccC